MYDTINMRLAANDVGGIDFLAATPSHLSDVGEHYYNGEVVISGDLNGLKVTMNRYQLKLKNGSLCKWYLGNNFSTMGRGDTQRAIEKLSDTLHLPIERATITRIDVADNLLTKHPPDVYFKHLGLLRYAKRLEQPDGLYYSQTDGKLCFYDKNREQRSRREAIPELYNRANVLRYEQRYLGRIASKLNAERITSATLYNERFYISVLNRWKQAYKAITKINEINLNFGMMKGKQRLYQMGILALVQQTGGEVQMIAQINEAQKQGILTNKQAFDLRQSVKGACKCKKGLTVQSDAIAELDKKIDEAVSHYR